MLPAQWFRGQRCPDGGQVTPLPGYLHSVNPNTLKPSVPTALQELPGTDINERVKSATGRWRVRQTERRTDRPTEGKMREFVRETGGRLSSSPSLTNQTNNYFLLWPGVQDISSSCRTDRGRKRGGRKAGKIKI